MRHFYVRPLHVNDGWQYCLLCGTLLTYEGINDDCPMLPDDVPGGLSKVVEAHRERVAQKGRIVPPKVNRVKKPRGKKR